MQRIFGRGPLLSQTGLSPRVSGSPRLHRSVSGRERSRLTRAFFLLGACAPAKASPPLTHPSPAIVGIAALVFLRAPPSLESDGLPPRCAGLRSKFRPEGVAVGAWGERSSLYARIASAFSKAGTTGMSMTGGTQGMGVDKLFAWDAATGLPQPKLERLAVPVRAVVLPLPPHARDTANALADAVSEALLPIVGAAGVWLQDREAMHTSIFHASHHLAEVPFTAEEVEAEAAAVAAVFNATCPLRAVLERVVVTPGGVVIACWNVASGGQPSEARAALRAALPRAPAHQLVSEPHILHSTLARILRVKPGDAATLERASTALTDALCGAEVVFDVAWYVEEYDALALALRGAYKERVLPFRCRPPATGVGGRLMDQARLRLF